MVVTNLPFEALLSPLRDVDVDLMASEYRSYINFTGERISHSCDNRMNGYESEFCDESELYFLTSARADLKYNGYSYACKRHLRTLVFQFAQTLEEKSLDREFDLWTDEQAQLEACRERLNREDREEEGVAL